MTTFEASVDALVAAAARDRELCSFLTGFEFAEERGWLDPYDRDRLDAARRELQDVSDQMAHLLNELADRWPDRWRAAMTAAVAHLEPQAAMRSDAARVRRRLRDALDGTPSTIALSWAIGGAVAILGRDALRPAGEASGRGGPAT